MVPDLDLRKFGDPNPVVQGQDLLYTINVRNRGPVAINDLTVEDDLPIENVDVITVESNAFGCQPVNPSTGLLVCELDGTLDPNKSAKIEVVVEAENAGTLTNTAQLFAAESDNPIAQATADTQVQAANTNGGNNNGTTTRDTSSDTTDDTTDSGVSSTAGDTGTSADAGGTSADAGNPDTQAPVRGPRGDAVKDVPFNEPLPPTGGMPVRRLASLAGLALAPRVALGLLASRFSLRWLRRNRKE